MQSMTCCAMNKTKASGLSQTTRDLSHFSVGRGVTAEACHHQMDLRPVKQLIASKFVHIHADGYKTLLIYFLYG